jgi:hypothetical protein
LNQSYFGIVIDVNVVGFLPLEAARVLPIYASHAVLRSINGLHVVWARIVSSTAVIAIRSLAN